MYLDLITALDRRIEGCQLDEYTPSLYSTTQDLRTCIQSAKTALEADENDETSEDSSSDEESLPHLGRSAETLERRCLKPLAKHADLLMDLFPILEQAFKDTHRPVHDNLVSEQELVVSDPGKSYVHNIRDKSCPIRASLMSTTFGTSIRWLKAGSLHALERRIGRGTKDFDLLMQMKQRRQVFH